MKKSLLMLFALLALTVSAKAQDKFLVAVGASVYANSAAHPQGQVALLVPVSEDGKNFSYTTFETRGPVEGQPTQSTRTGFARLVYETGRLKFFGLTDTGVSTSADSVAFAWSGGGAASIKINDTFKLLLAGEGHKSDAIGGWQPVVKLGFLFGGK